MRARKPTTQPSLPTHGGPHPPLPSTLTHTIACLCSVLLVTTMVLVTTVDGPVAAIPSANTRTPDSCRSAQAKSVPRTPPARTHSP